MMQRVAFLLPLVLAGCPRTKATDVADASPVVAMTAASVVVDAAPPIVKLDAPQLVQAWSDALDRHDLAVLERLYADDVFFYSAQRSRADVIKAKASALGPGSTFRQSIVGPILVTPDGRRATFTKRSGNGAKLAETKALLVLGGTPLRILEERDAIKPKGTCEDVASRVAWGHPRTKQIIKELEATLGNDTQQHVGGLNAGTFDDGVTHGAIGVHSPERFESIVFYDVENGAITVTEYGGKPFPIAPADAAEIKAACEDPRGRAP